MNKCILTGRTTKDIELRKTQSGMSMARFTLAVNRRTKEEGADFITCVAFGKTAEMMERYVKKGNRIAIEGHIRVSAYDKGGQRVYMTDVVVDGLEFIETKKTAETGLKTAQDEDYSGFADSNVISPDDLPF